MITAFLTACGICSSISLLADAQTPASTTSRTTTSRQLQNGKRQAGLSHRPTQAQLLQGAWAECATCDFNFALQGKRVTFYDPGTDGKPEVVYWKVANNRLSFIYPGGLVVTDAIVKLSKDSLVLYSNNKRAGVVGYSRFVRLK
jgi:hypothetical protein